MKQSKTSPRPGLTVFTGGDNQTKFIARQTVMGIVRQQTGLQKIPAGRTCIALSGPQTKHRYSQLNQYLAAGFLERSQYIGVDRDAKVIASNRNRHPDVRFEAGEWTAVYPALNGQRPLFVDLDTMVLGRTREAVGCLRQTMMLCPDDCVIAFTFMAKNPHGDDVCREEDVLETVKLPTSIMRHWAKTYATFTYQSLNTPAQVMVFYHD